MFNVAYSQQPLEPLSKYLFFRQRFNEKFVWVDPGTDDCKLQGYSIPVDLVDLVQENKVSFGSDGTMFLGWYFAVLSTEYKMYETHLQTNANPIIANQLNTTIYELYCALKALERLDRLCEKMLFPMVSCTYNGQPNPFHSTNGFFMRGDSWMSEDPADELHNLVK